MATGEPEGPATGAAGTGSVITVVVVGVVVVAMGGVAGSGVPVVLVAVEAAAANALRSLQKLMKFRTTCTTATITSGAQSRSTPARRVDMGSVTQERHHSTSGSMDLRMVFSMTVVASLWHLMACNRKNVLIT